ncbi:hypothetical protein [Streptomyces mirabilis]|uniref:hypothetical protein n=1 Tax=Streptomyces mirabilis TaxID=68239 RepID=UPI003CCF4E9E
MAVEQLPGQVREFASYLSGLMKRLDQDGGWCAVFWQRDPDGMRACLDGWEVPPWDVVEALLQDLAAEQGPQTAAQEAQRARALHSASLTAYDGRPGGRDALGDRLDVMLREQRYAAERQTELSRQLHAATTREEADTVRLDLAWAHDDHERASARCVELRHRMENLDRRALRTHVSGGFDFGGRGRGRRPGRRAGRPARARDPARRAGDGGPAPLDDPGAVRPAPALRGPGGDRPLRTRPPPRPRSHGAERLGDPRFRAVRPGGRPFRPKRLGGRPYRPVRPGR